MNEKKKIVILTADAGFGHRSAANAVHDALIEKYENEVAVEIINPLDHPQTPSLLRQTQSEYDNVVQKAPELYRLGYEVSDANVSAKIGQSGLAMLLSDAIRHIFREHQPDLIISTFPLYQSAIQVYFRLHRSSVPVLLVITDLITVHKIWFSKHVDFCLVPTEQVRQLAIQNGVPAERIRLTGIPVNPKMSKKPEDRRALREELGMDPDLPLFLAVGSKRVKHLINILDIFNHYGQPLQLALVAGNNQELFDALQNHDWHVPVKIFKFVENMAPLMHAADAMICKAGGLITTESLACGLPMMLVDVIPGQEEGNAQFVQVHRVGVRVNDQFEALQALHHWMENDRKLLNDMRFNAEALGKPEAAYTVADLAQQILSQGKPETNQNKRRSLSLEVAGLQEAIAQELVLLDRDDFKDWFKTFEEWWMGSPLQRLMRRKDTPEKQEDKAPPDE
ncbi:MAG: hypothetical protein JW750_09220 [Anaerolineaceae bacterium]|nr:hypothetical protein [Anaerolineaceae bacterium]